MPSFSTSMQRNLIWIGLVLGLIWLMQLLGGILTPFLVAICFAYLLQPMVNWIERQAKCLHLWFPRTLCVLLVEILALMLALFLILLVLPVLVSQLPQLLAKIPYLLNGVFEWLKPYIKYFGASLDFDPASIQKSVLHFFNDTGKSMLLKAVASIQVGGSWFVTMLSNALLIPLALFYFLYEWDWLLKKAQALIPVRLQAVYVDFFIEVNDVLRQYFRGELLVMLVLAVFYSLGLFLFGLKLALPIGVFTGLAVFVPYLGYGLGLIMAGVAGLLQFGLQDTILMVLLVYGMGQLLESFYLTPYWVGKRLGLHPLVIVFLLMLFGQVFGFIGVLLALPLSAVLAVVVRRLKSIYSNSAFYLDQQ